MKEHRGFGKASVGSSYLKRILASRGLSPVMVRAELVRVNMDLSSEVHYHKEAHTYVVVVGESEHLPRPLKAKAFICGSWQSVADSREIQIPPHCEHGFMVGRDGILYFLSIESPPSDIDDEEDYYRVDLKDPATRARGPANGGLTPITQEIRDFVAVRFKDLKLDSSGYEKARKETEGKFNLTGRQVARLVAKIVLQREKTSP